MKPVTNHLYIFFIVSQLMGLIHCPDVNLHWPHALTCAGFQSVYLFYIRPLGVHLSIWVRLGLICHGEGWIGRIHLIWCIITIFPTFAVWGNHSLLHYYHATNKRIKISNSCREPRRNFLPEFIHSHWIWTLKSDMGASLSPKVNHSCNPIRYAGCHCWVQSYV